MSLTFRATVAPSIDFFYNLKIKQNNSASKSYYPWSRKTSRIPYNNCKVLLFSALWNNSKYSSYSILPTDVNKTLNKYLIHMKNSHACLMKSICIGFTELFKFNLP